MNVYTRAASGIFGKRGLVMSDFFLTAAQRRRLEEQLRATRDAGVFRRTLAVLEVASGRPVAETACLLRITRPSVYHWLGWFRSAPAPGSLVDRRGGRTKSSPTPELCAALESILSDQAAGDPMTEKKWIRTSAAHLSQMLRERGHSVSRDRVYSLLHDMGYSFRSNFKKKRATSKDDPRVSQQFAYIALQKASFASSRLPLISVDTKQKELIGNFARKGKTWCKGVEEVNNYDFTSLAVCRAVPFGVYDITKNLGYVYVGTSADTPAFAVDAIAAWWESDGSALYPEAKRLLILADGGGSNGYRFTAWKVQLQMKMCDCFGIEVTVCHYPPGCSKWNPVERMLFSQISINWAGKPLRTLEAMLGYIRGTTTSAGLTVKAFSVDTQYSIGETVTRAEMERLNLTPHEVCRDWNYTLSPYDSAHRYGMGLP
jgi:transposase